jgi:hypothetical protein
MDSCRVWSVLPNSKSQAADANVHLLLVTARRCALKDFTFSDGTRVAKGEWVGIPVGPMLHDPTKYPQPDLFDGFRFADPGLLGRDSSIQPEGPTKFTDINEKWHVWGTGKLTW